MLDFSCLEIQAFFPSSNGAPVFLFSVPSVDFFHFVGAEEVASHPELLAMAWEWSIRQDVAVIGWSEYQGVAQLVLEMRPGGRRYRFVIPKADFLGRVNNIDITAIAVGDLGVPRLDWNDEWLEPQEAVEEATWGVMGDVVQGVVLGVEPQWEVRQIRDCFFFQRMVGEELMSFLGFGDGENVIVEIPAEDVFVPRWAPDGLGHAWTEPGGG
jgi:hypothetical protein